VLWACRGSRVERALGSCWSINEPGAGCEALPACTCTRACLRDVCAWLWSESCKGAARALEEAEEDFAGSGAESGALSELVFMNCNPASLDSVVS